MMIVLMKMITLRTWWFYVRFTFEPQPLIKQEISLHSEHGCLVGRYRLQVGLNGCAGLRG